MRWDHVFYINTRYFRMTTFFLNCNHLTKPSLPSPSLHTNSHHPTGKNVTMASTSLSDLPSEIIAGIYESHADQASHHHSPQPHLSQVLRHVGVQHGSNYQSRPPSGHRLLQPRTGGSSWLSRADQPADKPAKQSCIAANSSIPVAPWCSTTILVPGYASSISIRYLKTFSYPSLQRSVWNSLDPTTDSGSLSRELYRDEEARRLRLRAASLEEL